MRVETERCWNHYFKMSVMCHIKATNDNDEDFRPCSLENRRICHDLVLVDDEPLDLKMSGVFLVIHRTLALFSHFTALMTYQKTHLTMNMNEN